MGDTDFKPYWRPLQEGDGPNSWIFYILAKTDGRHRPLAAVSTTGTCNDDESMHAERLVACCRRIVTVLSDPANRTAIRSEMDLAASYFASGRDEPEPVELPELNRRSPEQSLRHRPWDRESVPPFPFITAALLLGIGFDPLRSFDAPPRPEPLATVYRDTDIEWGMVVFDITELSLGGVMRYGIVGFKVGMAQFVATPYTNLNTGGFMNFNLPCGFPLRVLEEVRPRRAMSAVDYMTKFDWGGPTPEEIAPTHNRNMELLASLPLVEDAAFDVVWPKGNDDTHPPVPGTTFTAEGQKDLKYQAIRGLVEATQDMDDLDVAILNEVRGLPGFTDSLRQALLQSSDRLGNNRAAGRLLRLAFAKNGHLGLEGLKNVPAKGIFTALADGPVTSLSLCIDCVRGTPAQFANSLSLAPESLREVCLLQSPSRDSEALSAQILVELAARPPILSRINVIFAGAYSAALRRRFWLPTSSDHTALLDTFPVQQIFIRVTKGLRTSTTTTKSYDTLYLGDGLLRPERFAAGFLPWLLMLEDRRENYLLSEDTHSSFSFSCAPASLTADSVSSAPVSPIMCENLSLPWYFPGGWPRAICSPRARDLDPRGWTVLVSRGGNPPTESSGQQDIYHYAFMRAHNQPISVKDPPPANLLGPERLEVVGLEGFLAATAPGIDLGVVDARADDIRSTPVMGQVEAATVLLECLDAARALNGKFREAMKESPEDWSWYPELGVDSA